MAQMTQDALFGPVFVIPANLKSITYLLIKTYIYNKSSVNNERKPKKNSPRAQTTRLASFGPVLIVSAYPVAFFVISWYQK